MTRSAPLDISKIRNLIAGIQENLSGLRKITGSTIEEFITDPNSYPICESHLRRALEGILTIGTHILSRLLVRSKDYNEIILSLGKHEIIPPEFADRNKKLAGYRNRLVHLYWEVSKEEIYNVCREHLADIDQFCEYYLEYIRRK
ncbi:MAG: DUF86 domain-containing protein [Bacteroidetes bacterium]|nr:DUF86 domain-containing protein [Bacteroidota bacterium]